MQKTIKLSSETALQVCASLGALLRNKSVPTKDKDNLFKMIEGIKQFMTKEHFEQYVKAMKYVEQNPDLLQSMSDILKKDFENS